MRIVQILPELNEGGVERGTVETNREFYKLQHDSHIISAGGKFSESIHTDGGKHHSLDVCSKNIISAPSRIRKLSRLLEQIEPDIIHARSRVPAWLASFANKSKKRPFVTTVHGLNSVNFYSKIMTSGDRVICVSEVVRDHVIKNYSINEDKVRVIQRGVDTKAFHPERIEASSVKKFKEQYGLTGRFIITTIGRITWLKDYETFIEAMAILCKSLPEAVGVIVGGYRADKKEYFLSLQKLVKKHGLEQNIVFTGSLSNMPLIYQASDLVVNVSLKMGNMGRTVVESLAMGTPVVATTFKGLRNLIVDHENGFVIDTRDPENLAKAVFELHASSPNPESIRKTLPPEFTLDHMVKSILTVYDELV